VAFLRDHAAGTGPRHWECPLPGGGRVELIDRRMGLARQAG
jgi:hypothetical protein